MASIIYWLPGSPNPNGGASVLLEHVEALTRHGISSFAVAPAQFKLWRETTAKIIDGSGFWSYAKGSILVVPEVTDEQTMARYANAENLSRVIFCQSYRGIEARIDIFRDLDRFRIADVFANAPLVSSVIARASGRLNPTIVSCSIDTNHFRPGQKRLAVAYMPSKLPEAQAKIAGMLGPIADQIEWIRLSNATRDQVADALAASAIFLALGHREGFGLPPLEAMASGCLVVGFHAQGAKAYAEPTNGFWHEEGDYKGVANSLKLAIGLVQKNSEAYHRRLKAGAETVSRYTPKRMEIELMGYMANLIVSQGSSLRDFLT